jgi:hypothetical protein
MLGRCLIKKYIILVSDLCIEVEERLARRLNTQEDDDTLHEKFHSMWRHQ